MNQRWFHIVAGALILVLLLWQFGILGGSSNTNIEYPEKPIRIVVPYPAGGGSDTFTRIVERAIVDDELLPVPLVIQNLGGGSGTIGSRDVVEADPDGYSLLMHHHALLGVYVDDVADFGPDDFEVIARTGSMSMVIIVREDSEFQTLDQLLEKAKQYPSKVTFGANPGSQAYFTAKQLESSYPGARFAMVSADGGADRYARLIGGHLDCGIFALSEFLDFLSPEGTPPDQNIRALVLLSDQPHEAIPDVPTSKAQGYEVFMQNAYYWWAPKGTPQAIQDKLATVLEKAMQNERLSAELERLKINNEYIDGPEMHAMIDEVLATMRKAKAAGNTSDADALESGEEPVELPDIPLWVIGITALFLIGVIIQTFLGKVPEEEVVEDIAIHESTRSHSLLAALCFLAVVIYVFLLQTGWLPWTLLSTVMIVVVGGLLCQWKPRQMIVIAELGLLASLGTAYLFTEVLTGVILP